MSAFSELLVRDLRLAFRQGGATGTAIGFFLVVISILPLGLGPDLKLMARLAPGLLWVALLLSALLSLDRLFHDDFEDGSLETLAIICDEGHFAKNITTEFMAGICDSVLLDWLPCPGVQYVERVLERVLFK